MAILTQHELAQLGIKPKPQTKTEAPEQPQEPQKEETNTSAPDQTNTDQNAPQVPQKPVARKPARKRAQPKTNKDQ